MQRYINTIVPGGTHDPTQNGTDIVCPDLCMRRDVADETRPWAHAGKDLAWAGRLVSEKLRGMLKATVTDVDILADINRCSNILHHRRGVAAWR